MVFYGISQESLVFSWNTHKPLGECVYEVWYSIVYHKRVLHNYFTPWNRKYVTYMYMWHTQSSWWKVGCNSIENMIAFLYSDWLYFLCHGIKGSIPSKGVCQLKKVNCILFLSIQLLYFLETSYIVVNARKSSWLLMYTSILKFLFVITVGQCKYVIICKRKIVNNLENRQ